MKYLIAGLGNIGDEYTNTRHNIGFSILDAWADASNITFKDKRYGFVCTVKHRGRSFVLLKPSTYMNLSGNAVSYWLRKEKIQLENLMVVVDDIALPTGSIRIRPRGGDGGHNGLEHINRILGTGNYARIRFGIGDDFARGQQVNHVLGKWTEEELKALKPRIDLTIEMLKAFGFLGLELTMTRYNREGKISNND
ncbi:MAG: aminoacyl-tRNA hydrolase [Marinilabiliaceae bacterium]|jgi:PTH1 family peptidyl-tRNA hydrolase|nr:aminoacyl-tRNA hydrolase [Marinilabiliaceae bacterium]